MSGTPNRAGDLVVAKLDRRPQDHLHAAVVLEAWAGRTPEESMREVAELSSDSMAPGRPPKRPVPSPAHIDVTEFLVLVTVLASVFAWLPFLRDALGNDLARTIGWALPAALALDRLMRVRYLASAQLQTMQPALWNINALGLGAINAGLIIGPQAHIGIALTIIWGLPAVTAVRKWPLVYLNIVIASATWMAFGGPPELVLSLAALSVLAANSIAVITSDTDPAVPESPWIAGAAGITGAAAGILLTAEADMWSQYGWKLGVAVLSVSMCGWWGAVRLSMLWIDLPTTLAHVTIDDPRARWGDTVVSDAVSGALMRVVLPTWILIVAAVALGEQDGAALVGAFGMFAVAMLMLGLVVATKQWTAAALLSIAGAAVALVVPPAVPGLPMLVGAATSAAGFGVVSLMSFRDSATTFATRMIIR